MASPDHPARTILFCNCAYARTVPSATRTGMHRVLAAAGLPYESVPDLCQLVADRDPRLREWSGRESLVILACHPRAVRSLFAAAGAPLERTDVQLLNLRTQSVAEMAALLTLPVPEQTGAGTAAETLGETPGWVPWFPVIDRTRCVNCRQCLSFCLFGVYAQDAAGQVQVAQPRNCKTNCPACARICPEVAIIFPKYAEGAVSGEEIVDEAGERAKARQRAALMGGTDPYTALQNRRRPGQVRLLADQEPPQT